MRRDEMLERVRERKRPWDIVIIGGGATGLGAAVDAASRAYDTLLLEQSDFAKATSSRSTKLVHGGVRYLQQGSLFLVVDALRERGVLRRLAPHLVRDLAFVIPTYAWWEWPFYGAGLKVYDLLAGRYGFGRSRLLSRDEVLRKIPTVAAEGLRGGVEYHDGQFDDARLAINLAATAAEQGAVLLNYTRVVSFVKDAAGVISGVIGRDAETGEDLSIAARAVINATGPFADDLRRMDRPDAPSRITPSQGVHAVLDRSFLPHDSAVMVPHTGDGRVMFAIPWYDCVVVGTTDTSVEEVALEPRPLPGEVEFLLETANRYLSRAAAPEDVRSVFAGIRPLVKVPNEDRTAVLSRDHAIFIDPRSGLITIAGGKWTTYRKMAQDVVDQAALLAGLPSRPCLTESLEIHGSHGQADVFGSLARYGADAPALEALIDSAEPWRDPVHPRLQLRAGEVVWACRNEMARTVDDVLARRSRALLFDARAASEAAPRVAQILAAELGRDANWERQQVEDFSAIARNHIWNP